MSRTQLIVPMMIQVWARMTYTASLYGMIYVSIVFCIWQLPLAAKDFSEVLRGLILIPFVAVPVGGAFGMAVGMILGAVVSWTCTLVTLAAYYPIPHNSDYKATIRAINALVAMICMMLAIYRIFTPSGLSRTDSFLLILVLQAVLAGIGTWQATGGFVKWYERMLNPNRKNDKKYKQQGLISEVQP
jgi:hypothetical protein